MVVCGVSAPNCLAAASQIVAVQGRRPGVEQRLAIGLVHRQHQIEQRLVAHRHVVVILHADGDAERRRPAAAHSRSAATIMFHWAV